MRDDRPWTFTTRVIVAIVIFFCIELAWRWAQPAEPPCKPVGQESTWSKQLAEYLPAVVGESASAFILKRLPDVSQIVSLFWSALINWVLIPLVVPLAILHRWTIELFHRNLHTDEQNPPFATKFGERLVKRSLLGRFYHWLLGLALGVFFNYKWYQGLLSTKTLRAFLRALTEPWPHWVPRYQVDPATWSCVCWMVNRATTPLRTAPWSRLWYLWPIRTSCRFLLYTGSLARPLFDPVRVYERAQLFVEVVLLLGSRPAAISGRDEHIREHYLIRAQQRELGKTSMTPIECPTLFDVFNDGTYDVQQRIETYLKSQLELPKPKGPLDSAWRSLGAFFRELVGWTPRDAVGEATFLCPVVIRSGFLSPTFLVSGLLSEFDEDWKKIVWGYRLDMARLSSPVPDDKLAAFPALRKLQVFIWDCWIQWGPSVPICSSSNWSDGVIGLQYGYGDENNSLPLTWTKTPADGRFQWAKWQEQWTEWQHEWNDWQSKQLIQAAPGTGGGTASPPFVIPAQVTAELSWVTGQRPKFCGAQSRRSDAWLCLNAQTILPKWESPRMYSAYVWVIIAICETTSSTPAVTETTATETGSQPTDNDAASGDQMPVDANDGSGADKASIAAGGSLQRPYQLLYPVGGKECWRSLIPFFQHGNIAEECVYEDIKEELAAKVIDGLMRFLEESRGPDCHIEFAYVCAFDDNGDGDHQTGSMQLPGRPTKSIRDMLVADLKRYVARDPRLLPPPGHDRSPELERLKQRVHLEHDAVPELTACMLPGIAQQFLEATGEIPDTTRMRIVNLREQSNARAYLPALKRAYDQLYVAAFPFPDEQESYDQYRERVLIVRGSAPETHFLIAGSNLEDEQSMEIGGFLIVEWYRRSRCGLLTYLAVAPDARQQGLATRLIKQGLDLLIARNEDHRPRAVFAETGNPNSVVRRQAHADTLHPVDRLRTLRQLGAHLVPIKHYVQPKLGIDQQASHDLLLLAFDPSGEKALLGGSETLDIDVMVCEDFLTEFYESLGATTPDDRAALDAMKSELLQASELPAESAAQFGDIILKPIRLTKPAPA